jgi:hypothetical protein
MEGKISTEDEFKALQNRVRTVKPKLEEAIRKNTSMYKSKLEQSWASYLHGLLMLKAITWYCYEPLNLRLPGEKNFYKPDFLVLAGDKLTFYEVKGRNPSDDRSLVKIKTAAGITPWARFVLVKRIGGIWEERLIT